MFAIYGDTKSEDKSVRPGYFRLGMEEHNENIAKDAFYFGGYSNIWHLFTLAWQHI